MSADPTPSIPTHSETSESVTPLIGTCVTFGTTHWAETVLKLSPEAAVMTAPDQLVVAMFVGVVMVYNFPAWFDRSRVSGTPKGVRAK